MFTGRMCGSGPLDQKPLVASFPPVTLCSHMTVSRYRRNPTPPWRPKPPNDLFAGFQSGSLDDFDPRAVWSSHVGIVDSRTVRHRERARFAGYRHAFGAQAIDGFRQRAGRAEAEVVDGAPFAGLRIAALHQDPDGAEAGRTVLDAVDASLELCALTAELREHPV